MRKNTKAFSIIEVMIGISIFTAGMISIYLVISGSLKLVEDSKNKIIASNLARENIELVKNIRNTNFDSYRSWDYFDVGNDGNFENIFAEEKSYKIQNTNIVEDENSSSNDLNIEMTEITSLPEVSIDNIENGSLSHLNLRLSNGAYRHSDVGEKTHFYRYTTITPVSYVENGNNVLDGKAVKVTSKVFWYYKGLNDVEVSTVLTNWKNY